MDLGAFSVSLAVKDLDASRAFYERLGFQVFGGDATQGWQILRNPAGTTLGLFCGMFDRNLLTFNPGWCQDMSMPEEFTDVRAIAATLRDAGLPLVSDTTEATPSGPASFVVIDPDGNPVLVDQHR